MFEKVDPLTMTHNQKAEAEADANMGKKRADEWRNEEAFQESLEKVESSDNMEIIEIPGPAGKIPLFICRAESPRGIVFHIHGGGWFFGTHLGSAIPLGGSRAENIQATTVSIGYRLAPEHPYPAASDDCEAAATWLVQNAREILGSDKIVFYGASAGAHLAVVTLLRLRDRHSITSIRGAVLSSGLYDFRLTPSARKWRDRKLIWNGEVLRNAVKWFAGDADPEDPDVSPIFADLHDMPPAFFIAGTDEALIDDTRFMHARWQTAGADTELHIVPNGSHVADMVPTIDGALCRALTLSYISRAFGE